jgi:hypothetical protein
LQHSGQFRSFPVITDCGGESPGQIRDKSRRKDYLELGDLLLLPLDDRRRRGSLAKRKGGGKPSKAQERRQRERDLQRPDPTQLEQLRHKEKQLGRAIDYAKREVGETPEEQAQTSRLLNELRLERGQTRTEISKIELMVNRPVRIPTEAEVRAELVRLEEILVAVDQGGSVEQQSLGARLLT